MSSLPPAFRAIMSAMNRGEFDRAVRQAIDELPTELLSQIANVAIIVEEWPAEDTRLFDLFFGVDESSHNPPT